MVMYCGGSSFLYIDFNIFPCVLQVGEENAAKFLWELTRDQDWRVLRLEVTGGGRLGMY